MPELDRIKEEIGWLKVVFALLVAADLSLLGWLAQNLGTASHLKVVLALVVMLAVAISVVWVNRMAYIRIERIGRL